MPESTCRGMRENKWNKRKQTFTYIGCHKHRNQGCGSRSSSVVLVLCFCVNYMWLLYVVFGLPEKFSSLGAEESWRSLRGTCHIYKTRSSKTLSDLSKTKQLPSSRMIAAMLDPTVCVTLPLWCCVVVLSQTCLFLYPILQERGICFIFKKENTLSIHESLIALYYRVSLNEFWNNSSNFG